MPAANGKLSGRFELPQLTPVNYSLTEGTNIPPPPDSPVEEKAPEPKPKQEPTAPTVAANGQTVSPITANGVYEGRGRTSNADHPPLSPASTTRPSSIRRFLSRKSLNSIYANGSGTNKSQEDVARIERPGSALSLSQPKKTGGWFRRLGSASGANRTSVVYENPPEVAAPKGPPAPKLPELNQLKAKIADDDEGSLGGGDMFKNIK